MKVICENYNICKYKNECLHSKPHNALDHFSANPDWINGIPAIGPSKFPCHLDKNAPYDFNHSIWINNNLSINPYRWIDKEHFCNCNINKMIKFLRKEKLEKIQNL